MGEKETKMMKMSPEDDDKTKNMINFRKREIQKLRSNFGL